MGDSYGGGTGFWYASACLIVRPSRVFAPHPRWGGLTLGGVGDDPTRLALRVRRRVGQGSHRREPPREIQGFGQIAATPAAATRSGVVRTIGARGTVQLKH